MNQMAQAYYQLKDHETEISVINISVSYNYIGYICTIEFVHKNHPEIKLSITGWDSEFERIAINSAQSKVHNYDKQIARKSMK